MMEATLVAPNTVTGRFTLDELVHFIGPMAWPSGVPEATDNEEQQGLRELLHQVQDYLERTPGAVAVDIMNGQVLNVVTHS